MNQTASAIQGSNRRIVAPTTTGHTSRSLQHPALPSSEWMLSKDVAKIIGVKTSTLRKWRAAGKGPAEWANVAKTVVVYRTTAVGAFLRSWEQLDGESAHAH